MAIASLIQAKKWLRLELDYTEEDSTIQTLLDAAERYIYNATGTHFTSDNPLAVLLQQVLVCEMYERREATACVTEQIRQKPIVQSMVLQLQYAESGEAT